MQRTESSFAPTNDNVQVASQSTAEHDLADLADAYGPNLAAVIASSRESAPLPADWAQRIGHPF